MGAMRHPRWLLILALFVPSASRADSKNAVPPPLSLKFTEGWDRHHHDGGSHVNAASWVTLQFLAEGKLRIEDKGMRKESDLFSTYYKSRDSEWRYVWRGTWEQKKDTLSLALELAESACETVAIDENRSANTRSENKVACNAAPKAIKLECESTQVKVGANQQPQEVWLCTRASDQPSFVGTPTAWVFGKQSCLETFDGRMGRVRSYGRCAAEKSELDAPVDAGLPATLSLSTACQVRFANPKDLAHGGLRWQPCRGGVNGCRALETMESGMIGAPSIYAVAATTQEGIVMLARVAPLKGNLMRAILTPLDGPPRLSAELSSTRRCTLSSLAIGQEGAALEVVDAENPDQPERWFVGGVLNDGASWRRISAHLPRSRDEIIFNIPLAVGAGVLSGVDARGRVFRSQPQSADFRRWPVGADMPGSLCCVVSQPTRTYFLVETIPERVGVQDGERPPRVLRQPAAGGGIPAFTIDGDTAWWLEGSGRDRNNQYTAMALFTSPLSKESGELQPQRVAAVSPSAGRSIVAGDGRVAWFEAAAEPRRQSVVVFEPRTARAVRYTPAQPATPWRILAVDRRELLIEVGGSAKNGASQKSETWRLPLDALDPVQLPSS
jgi:hypothetical protein